MAGTVTFVTSRRGDFTIPPIARDIVSSCRFDRRYETIRSILHAPLPDGRRKRTFRSLPLDRRRFTIHPANEYWNSLLRNKVGKFAKICAQIIRRILAFKRFPMAFVRSYRTARCKKTVIIDANVAIAAVAIIGKSQPVRGSVNTQIAERVAR